MRPGLPGYEPWYEPILHWMSQLSPWGWVGCISVLFTFLYLLYLMIYWRAYLGEPMELRYDGGYPGVEKILDGELELTNQEIRFKDLWKPDRIYFSIPLAQISAVSNSYGDFSLVTFWFIGAYAVLTQHNFLRITFRDSKGKERIVRFYANRHSKSPKIWKQRLREVIQAKV